MVRARKAAYAAALTTAALAAPPAAMAAVTPKTAGMDGGSFAPFDQTNVLRGTLSVSSARAYDGTRSAKASASSTSSTGGFSRGVYNVSWSDGDDVWFGMAVYLAPGFKSLMRGGVDLMRWDNWPSYGSSADFGGLALWRSDKKVHLVRGTYDSSGEDSLITPFDIAEGRWVWLEVHQRLGAQSEVWVDGRLAGRSGVSTYGRPVERVRYGIVSLSYAQGPALTLWFDRATVSTGRIGPLAKAGVARRRQGRANA